MNINENDAQQTENTVTGIQFCCRICGATKYKETFTAEVVEEVTQSFDMREPIDVEKCQPLVGYECAGCSITFQDPFKFSKHATP